MGRMSADDEDALGAVIDAVTLGWIVPAAAPEHALLMPMVRDSAPGSVLGHLPLRHPATRALADAPRAELLFLGPNEYVSNAVVGVPGWAPTWHFVSARLDVDIELDDALTRSVLDATAAHLEPEWQVGFLGDRYAALATRIIGFRATIRSADARLRLGHDETEATRERIDAHRAGSPLAEWVRRFRRP